MFSQFAFDYVLGARIKASLTIAIPLAFLFLSCSTPYERLQSQASASGFKQIRLAGDGFSHRAFINGLGSWDSTLHVYIEGDGTPWLTPTWVSHDPTPRNPLALRLMALDTNPAIYLGRPCYMGLAEAPECHPIVWTHQRYSRKVVDSMAAALHDFLGRFPFSRLVFFGYSGGGALAILLAEYFPQSDAVVTIAGNLDIEKWAVIHRYDPLEGSINPATDPTRNLPVREYHYVGESDTNVIPEIVLQRAAIRPNTEVRIKKGFDHTCCWPRIWREILTHVDTQK